MKLLKLNVTKTRNTPESASIQKNGRIRISSLLAEKMEFKEGESVDLFIDEEDKNYLYICKGSMYKLFRHIAGSNSALYFGSITMLKELGIENPTLHTLTSRLMKFNKVLYLQLDLSEMLPKVFKPMPVEKEEEKQPEEKPTNNSRNRNKPTTTAAPKEEEPTFL